MKIIVTGASGLLGRRLMRELRCSTSHEVIGMAYRRSQNDLISLNLLDHDKAKTFWLMQRPDWIIHTAVDRNLNKSEANPAQAFDLNVKAIQTLLNCVSQMNTRILYISTDYVFDGTAPPYYPDTPPNPINVYGKSKQAAEELLLKAISEVYILRLPLLYGSVEYLEESVVTGLVALFLKQNGKIVVDNWAIRYPTYTDDVAVVCRQIIELINSGYNKLPRVCHWSAKEAYTKFEIIRLIATMFELKTDNIIPTVPSTDKVLSPRDCCLDSTLLEELDIGQETDFKTVLYSILANFCGNYFILEKSAV